MNRIESIAVVVIIAGLLGLCVLEVIVTDMPHHPSHRMERELGCVAELLDTHAIESGEEPITITLIKDLGAKGCAECPQCTKEILAKISEGEDMWGHQLRIRVIETRDYKVLYEIRSIGKNGREERQQYGGDDVYVYVSIVTHTSEPTK